MAVRPRGSSLEMAQTVFELESAAADVAFRDGQGQFVLRLHHIAWLPGDLAAVKDLPGQNGAPRLFAGRAKSALDQGLIQTEI